MSADLPSSFFILHPNDARVGSGDCHTVNHRTRPAVMCSSPIISKTLLNDDVRATREPTISMNTNPLMLPAEPIIPRIEPVSCSDAMSGIIAAVLINQQNTTKFKTDRIASEAAVEDTRF